MSRAKKRKARGITPGLSHALTQSEGRRPEECTLIKGSDK